MYCLVYFTPNYKDFVRLLLFRRVDHFRQSLGPTVPSLGVKIVDESVLLDVKLKYNVKPFSLNELKATVASVYSVGKASGDRC